MSWTPEKLTEYQAKIAAMSNRELIDETASQILSAAVMARFRTNDGRHDDMCDACYDECVRRGNPDLYQRAFNSVADSQGHTDMKRPVSTPVEHGDPTLTGTAA